MAAVTNFKASEMILIDLSRSFSTSSVVIHSKEEYLKTKLVVNHSDDSSPGGMWWSEITRPIEMIPVCRGCKEDFERFKREYLNFSLQPWKCSNQCLWDGLHFEGLNS